MGSLAVRIRSNSTYALLSHVVRLLSNLLLFAGVARLYGLEAFGQFTAAHTMSTLFLLAADFGFDTLLPTRIARTTGDLTAPLARYFTLKLLFGGAAMATMLVVSLITALPETTAVLVRVFASYVIFGSLSNFAFAVFKGRQEFHHEARISFAANALLLIGLLVLGWLRVSIVVVAVVFVLTRLVMAAQALLRVRSAVGGKVLRPRFDGLRPLLQSVLIFGLHFVFGNLFFQVDTILLMYLRPETDVGIYQSAFKIAVLALILPDIAVTSTLPALTQLHGVDAERWREGGRLLAKFLLLAAVPVCLMLFTGAKDWIRLVYGAGAFAGAATVLQVFAATVLVRFAVDAYALMMTTADRQAVRLWIVMGGTALNIALNVFMIPKYGATGAAVVSLITNVAVGAGYIFWSGMPFAQWMREARILLVAGITAGCLGVFLLIGEEAPWLAACVLGAGSAVAAYRWGLSPAERGRLVTGIGPLWGHP